MRFSDIQCREIQFNSTMQFGRCVTRTIRTSQEPLPRVLGGGCDLPCTRSNRMHRASRKWGWDRFPLQSGECDNVCNSESNIVLKSCDYRVESVTMCVAVSVQNIIDMQYATCDTYQNIYFSLSRSPGMFFARFSLVCTISFLLSLSLNSSVDCA
jgi:hypothetical protein